MYISVYINIYIRAAGSVMCLGCRASFWAQLWLLLVVALCASHDFIFGSKGWLLGLGGWAGDWTYWLDIAFGNSAWYNLMCGVIEMASALQFNSKDETRTETRLGRRRLLCAIALGVLFVFVANIVIVVVLVVAAVVVAAWFFALLERINLMWIVKSLL